MASRNSDVQLVIRAKDEAQKTIDAVAGALDSLFKSQNNVSTSATKTGSSIADLARIAGTLDKAYASISGGADRAAQAFERQQKAVGEQRNQLSALQKQAQSAANVLAKLNGADAIVGAGRDQAGRLAQIKTISAEYERLQSQMSKLASGIATQDRALGSSASSLQVLSSNANAVEIAVSKARVAIDQQTAAMQRQAAAAKVAGNVNTATGVSRGAATDNGAGFEALAAREIATQTRREDAARAAAAAVRDSVITSTGANRGRATDNGAGFGALDQMMKAQEASAARLRSALDPSLTIRKAYNDQIREAIKLYRDELVSVDELRKRIGQLRDQQRAAQQTPAAKNAIGFLGLRPYELQNLSYQLNDVFTQLASGTSLTQTLSQQGGQILQLFPKVGSSIAAAFTSVPLIGFAVGMTAIVVGVNRLLANIEQLRQIDAILVGNADAANYSAAQLQATAKAMREFGISTEDAMKVTRIAIQRGLAQDEILNFSKAAKGLSVLLGVDVSDAAGRLATALKGGFTALQELNKQTNLFSADELKLIRQLYEQGKATEAAAKATEILDDRLAKVADTAESKATKSARELTVAWNDMLDAFSKNVVFQTAINGLTNIANAAAAAAKAIGGIEDLQDKKDRLQGILDTRSGFLGTSGSLRDRSIATATGLKAKPGFENDSTTSIQLKQANALLDEIAKAEGKITDAQRESAAAQAKGATEREKASAAEVEAATAVLDANTKITKQADIQTALAAERKRLTLDAQSRFPGTGSVLDAARAEYVSVQLTQKKVALEAQLTAYKDQQAAKSKAAAAADEQALKSYVSRVVKAESGGNPNAKNPNSSATGAGQFIESTWTALFQKYFPERAADMTQGAILALRKDADVSRTMIELYARENARALQKSGQAVTEANLHLAHFLGAGGAAKVLGAKPGASIADLFTDKAGRQAIAANPTILGKGSTRESVLAYATKRAGGNGKGGVGETQQTELELADRLAEIEKDRLDTQVKFDAKVADENEKRVAQIEALTRQKGLVGEALITEEKRQAIVEAVLQKQQEIDKLNAERATRGLPSIAFTEEQRAEIEKTTGAYFDLAHARDVAEARRNVVDNPVGDLTSQRDVLQQQMQFYRETGNFSMADNLQPQLDKVNGSLREALNNAIAFYSALKPGDDPLLDTQSKIDAVVSKLQLARDSSIEWINVLGISGQTIAQTFASQASSALDQFAQAVANGKNAFTSLGQAFLQFAAQFMRQIAQMIQQQIIFNLISGLVSSIGGMSSSGIASANQSVGSTISSNAAIFHEGGIAGDTSAPTRLVNPAWFVNARRYHTGGIAGLAANEVPAVLQRGEEVLTASDARHSANGGGGGGAAPQIKIVNAIDAADMVSQGLNTTAGEKAVLNMVKNNPGAFKAAIG